MKNSMIAKIKEVSMSYNLKKLIDILTILAKNNQDLTKLRINKFLYFIDKFHLQKYGRDVSCDIYKRLPKGPIADNTTNLLKSFENNLKYGFTNDNIKELSKYFNLKKINNEYKLILRKKSSLNSLSLSEREIIKDVIRKYGKKSTEDLIAISHKDKAWKLNKPSSIIDKKMLLEGLSDKDKEFILGLMEIDSQSQRVSQALTKC